MEKQPFAKFIFEELTGNYSPEDYEDDMKRAVEDWDNFQSRLKELFETQLKEIEEENEE